MKKTNMHIWSWYLTLCLVVIAFAQTNQPLWFRVLIAVCIAWMQRIVEVDDRKERRRSYR